MIGNNKKAIGYFVSHWRSGGSDIDADAQAHYDRVIADGGVADLTRVNYLYTQLKSIYGVSDLTTIIPAAYDAYWLGYKLGAGSGTTLGQAAQTLYSLVVGADVLQTTAASQPLLLAHTGSNYWSIVATDNNLCTTPDNIANDITGDIEIISQFSVPNITDVLFLIGKDLTSIRLYNLSYYNNIAYLSLNLDGVWTTTASASLSFTANTTYWIKANYNSITGFINFYKSTDGITFTQVGTPINVGIHTIISSPIQVSVGSFTNGNVNGGKGKIYRATISNSIGGTPVVDFNPATYLASTSQTQWTSTTGEVWTINTGTATTGYNGVLVDRTIIQTDNSTSYLQRIGSDLLTGNNVLYSIYSACENLANQAQQTPLSLNKSSANLDFCGGSNIAFYAQDNAGTVRRFDPAITLNYLLQLIAIVGDSTTTAYLNNVIKSSSSTAQTTSTFNLINIGRGRNYNNYSGNINTIIISNAADNSIKRGLLYTLISYLSNNAF